MKSVSSGTQPPLLACVPEASVSPRWPCLLSPPAPARTSLPAPQAMLGQTLLSDVASCMCIPALLPAQNPTQIPWTSLFSQLWAPLGTQGPGTKGTRQPWCPLGTPWWDPSLRQVLLRLPQSVCTVQRQVVNYRLSAAELAASPSSQRALPFAATFAAQPLSPSRNEGPAWVTNG